MRRQAAASERWGQSPHRLGERVPAHNGATAAVLLRLVKHQPLLGDIKETLKYKTEQRNYLELSVFFYSVIFSPPPGSDTIQMASGENSFTKMFYFDAVFFFFFFFFCCYGK